MCRYTSRQYRLPRQGYTLEECQDGNELHFRAELWEHAQEGFDDMRVERLARLLLEQRDRAFH